MNLISLFEENKINYDAYRNDIYHKNLASNIHDDGIYPYHISVIVPVRGRVHFMDPVYSHLKAAADNCSKSIAITFVEHSELPEFLRKCPSGYIWVPCEKESRFNKCMAFNIGFIYGPQAAYYLFYDGDLLCNKNFFNDLIECKSPSQAFKGKRVIYANAGLTQGFVNNEYMYAGEISPETDPGMKVGVPGAPGGALFVSREHFIEVGGYDAEYFTGYSVEDQFFFNKLSLFNKVGSAENIELIHLDHGMSHALTLDFHMSILNTWNELSEDQKINLIKIKSDYFKSFLS